jgi:hypothetical protein
VTIQNSTCRRTFPEYKFKIFDLFASRLRGDPASHPTLSAQSREDVDHRHERSPQKKVDVLHADARDDVDGRNVGDDHGGAQGRRVDKRNPEAEFQRQKSAKSSSGVNLIKLVSPSLTDGAAK